MWRLFLLASLPFWSKEHLWLRAPCSKHPTFLLLSPLQRPLHFCAHSSKARGRSWMVPDAIPIRELGCLCTASQRSLPAIDWVAECLAQEAAEQPALSPRDGSPLQKASRHGEGTCSLAQPESDSFCKCRSTQGKGHMYLPRVAAPFWTCEFSVSFCDPVKACLPPCRIARHHFSDDGKWREEQELPVPVTSVCRLWRDWPRTRHLLGEADSCSASRSA